MEEEKKYKYKACPFRANHFCGACELLIPNIDMCIFKCLNANLGLIAKILIGDTKIAEKIKETLKEKE